MMSKETWDTVKKYCPIRRFCFWLAEQFVDFARLAQVLVDFHTGRGCNRHVQQTYSNKEKGVS